MTSNATVIVSTATNALTVPNLAITRLGGQAYVTVYASGQQVQTPIETGVVGDTVHRGDRRPERRRADRHPDAARAFRARRRVALAARRSGSAAAADDRARGGSPRPTAWARSRWTRCAGIDLDDRRGRVRRHHGRQRLGQVDADEHRRLPRRADQRAATSSTAPTWPGSTTISWRRSATERSGSSSSPSTSSRARRALHNVEMPLIYAGPGGPNARVRWRRCTAVGLADRAGHQPDRAFGRPAAAGRDRAGAGHDPAILLADEPTGNLDTRIERRDHEAARPAESRAGPDDRADHSRAGHRRFAKRVVELRDGRIVSDRQRAA